MDTANPSGADTTSLSHAASRLSAVTKKPDPKQEVRQEVKPEVTAEPEQETQEVEVQDESPEQESSDEGTTEAQETSQETSFERLEQLAEALDMPVEKFLQTVKGKVKISGQEKEVTLEEALKGYQLESDYRQKTMTLAEERKAFEADRQRVASEFQSRIGEASQMAQFFEQQLMNEYNQINWQELRTQNPAEYAALQQDYNQRYQQLQGAKQRLALQVQQFEMEEQHKSTEALRQSLAEEQAKLSSLIPEFQDQEKAKALKTEMRDFLKSNGFDDDEINNVHDHRHVLILRDAMKYRALQSKKPEVTNKVKDAPKLLKPGVKPSGDRNGEIVKNLRAKLRKSGNVKDAAALLSKL